jgi:tetratricopeptide (TPR) repeat protein
MTTAMRDIEPIIMERFPDMLQPFTVARAQANAALTAEMRKSIENLEETASRSSLTFEASIKELEEADGKGTLTDYLIAQILFQRRIRTEKQYAIYEPWLAKVKDDKTRLDLTSYFWFIRAELAIKEKRFDEAEKMAAKVPELDHRAVLLLAIAKIHLDSTSDAGSAFGILNSVSKLARSAPNSVAKAQVLFSLVQFYGRVNHTVALDELGEAVRVVNQLEEPDLFQNWVFRQIVGKDFSFMASISLPGNNMEGMFSDLGKRDFEMALANARGFDDKYFRTIAVIAIANNCIPARSPAVRKPDR